jgi:hypothetical protein
VQVGRVSRKASLKLVIILLLQFLLIVGLLSHRAWKNTSRECIHCHSDRDRLRSLGAEWAYVTLEEVQKQSHHPYIDCRDCHLGDGRAKDPQRAHKGMLKMLIVSEDGKLLPRKKGYPGPLKETGEDEMFALMPKIKINNEMYILSGVRNILWHDRNPETLSFDPDIAEKTCGKKGCHPEALKQFKSTIMGRNLRQRTMRTWLKPYGPHNCGPSFADLQPPEVLKASGFDYKNTNEIRQDLAIPFTIAQAEAKQKFCNVCHGGCLDCHYRPSNKEGRHAFIRTPDSKTCLGAGRTATICHAGAMLSRRGETYTGEWYSIPQGMKPDVHYSEGIHCIDCHLTGEKGMGDIEREASCQDCHIDEEEALKKGLHKKMLCAACHIKETGGYQITVWGPGKVAEKENPFRKYSLYYGTQSPPILMKDQKGLWIPVKVWPHSVGNIKPDVPASERIMFRWPDGQTRDAYYIIGTFDQLPANNKHLLWIELQEVSHPYTKARDCDSCHTTSVQISYSEWEFYDNDGAEPFKGGYKIIADEKGLTIVALQNTTPIKPLPGRKLSDFASWIYVKDKWRIPGDFSIKVDRDKYLKYKEIYTNFKVLLDKCSTAINNLSKKEKKEFKRKRLQALHHLDSAKDLAFYCQ